MLVMSRKKDDGVIINDNIVVTVVEIRGDKVRLGFDMPREVPIHRKEVYDAILHEHHSGFQIGTTLSYEASQQQVICELRQTVESLNRLVQSQAEQIRGLEAQLQKLQ